MIFFSDETAFDKATQPSDASDGEAEDCSENRKDRGRRKPRKLTPGEQMLQDLTSVLAEYGGYESKSGMEHRQEVLKSECR